MVAPRERVLREVVRFARWTILIGPAAENDFAQARACANPSRHTTPLRTYFSKRQYDLPVG